MNDPLVTIVVAQRERFAYNAISLEGIYKNTSIPFKLVYIDSASPPHVKHYLETQASQKGFKLIRVEHFLPSNKSHNLGQAEVDTKYVVFVDNDLFVTPGWLEKLVDCAEETQAWVVGPLYLEGAIENQIVHTAATEAHFKIVDGQRRFHGPLKFEKRKLSEVQDQLRREPVECLEFHCLLVRNNVFDTIGPMDENFVGVSDHQDFCLTVREAGGTIYYEPAAIVSFPHLYFPLLWSDLPLFFKRWNETSTRKNVDYIRTKWKLTEDDPYIRRMTKFSRKQRRFFIRLWFPWQLHKAGRIVFFPVVFVTEKILGRLFRGNTISPG